jgi:hypothetical protein
VGQVSHALWQAPSGNSDEWLARINLLNVTVQKKTEDAARPAKVDPKTKMKLRDDVQKLLDDKAKKKNDDDNR